MSAAEFYQAAKEHLSYFRLSLFRCVLYGTIVAWGMFQTGTEGFEHFSDMTGFQQCKLFGNMIFTGFGGVMLAFLDQTISSILKIKLEHEKVTP